MHIINSPSPLRVTNQQLFPVFIENIFQYMYLLDVHTSFQVVRMGRDHVTAGFIRCMVQAYVHSSFTPCKASCIMRAVYATCFAVCKKSSQRASPRLEFARAQYVLTYTLRIRAQFKYLQRVVQQREPLRLNFETATICNCNKTFGGGGSIYSYSKEFGGGGTICTRCRRVPWSQWKKCCLQRPALQVTACCCLYRLASAAICASAAEYPCIFAFEFVIAVYPLSDVFSIV